LIVDVQTAKIAIVTINYNGMEDTARLLSSIDAVSENMAVIVVDNASSERPLALKDKFPNIELVLSDVNGGFGYGNNLGVRRCDEITDTVEYIFILNNDTVLTDGCVSTLQYTLLSGDNICASPLIFYPNCDTLWFGGGRFSLRNVGATSPYKDRSSAALDLLDTVYESPFLSGCAMFMRKVDYLKVGGFDERFFMYVEDVDLSYRLNNLGRLVISKEASITHFAHSSLGTNITPLSLNNPKLDFYVNNVINGTMIYIKSNFFGVKKILLYSLFFVKWQRNGIRLGIRGLILVNKCIFGAGRL
jgi:GT2 family glycosyltransferase